MAILTKDEALALMKKVLSYSKADECEVNLTGTNTSNVRYARNAVSTSGTVNQTTLLFHPPSEKSWGSQRSTNTTTHHLKKWFDAPKSSQSWLLKIRNTFHFWDLKHMANLIHIHAATAALTPALRADSRWEKSKGCEGR